MIFRITVLTGHFLESEQILTAIRHNLPTPQASRLWCGQIVSSSVNSDLAGGETLPSVVPRILTQHGGNRKVVRRTSKRVSEHILSFPVGSSELCSWGYKPYAKMAALILLFGPYLK